MRRGGGLRAGGHQRAAVGGAVGLTLGGRGRGRGRGLRGGRRGAGRGGGRGLRGGLGRGRRRDHHPAAGVGALDGLAHHAVDVDRLHHGLRGGGRGGRDAGVGEVGGRQDRAEVPGEPAVRAHDRPDLGGAGVVASPRVAAVVAAADPRPRLVVRRLVEGDLANGDAAAVAEGRTVHPHDLGAALRAAGGPRVADRLGLRVGGAGRDARGRDGGQHVSNLHDSSPCVGRFVRFRPPFKAEECSVLNERRKLSKVQVVYPICPPS